MNNYDELLNYLEQRSMFGIKLGLDNIRSSLEKIGNPHRGLRYVHIAGTNGKGSVAVMVSSVLKQSGINVGLYTSPHLLDVRERIKINDVPISKEQFLDIVCELQPYMPQQITYFELLTLVAIKYFSTQKVDIAIMEVGMGGRLDATNICDAEIAVITNIDMEHSQYLGTTLEEIAREKAAVIKKGACVVSGVVTEEAEGVIAAYCKDQEAHLLSLGKEIDYGIEERSLSSQKIWVKTKKAIYNELDLNLLGDYQAGNCALAVTIIELLQEKGYPISIDSIKKGLANVTWPARFQIVAKDPLMIIDGAHNPAAFRVLKDAIDYCFNDRNIIIILGILKDKDYCEMIRILAPAAKTIFAVAPDNKRALSAKTLADLVIEQDVICITNSEEAVARAREMAGENDVVIVAGSLYLAGEVMAYLEKNKVKLN